MQNLRSEHNKTDFIDTNSFQVQDLTPNFSLKLLHTAPFVTFEQSLKNRNLELDIDQLIDSTFIHSLHSIHNPEEVYILKSLFVSNPQSLDDKVYRELLVYRLLSNLRLLRKTPHYITVSDWWKTFGTKGEKKTLPRNEEALMENLCMNFLLERADVTLQQFVQEKSTLPIALYKLILFQLLFALYQAQNDCEFVHHDLHMSNILLQKNNAQASQYIYHVGEKSFGSMGLPGPYQNILVKITDFGTSRARIAEKKFINGGTSFDTSTDLVKLASELRNIKLDWHGYRKDQVEVEIVKLNFVKKKMLSGVGVSPGELLLSDFFVDLEVQSEYNSSGQILNPEHHFGDFQTPNPLPKNDFEHIGGNLDSEIFIPKEIEYENFPATKSMKKKRRRRISLDNVDGESEDEEKKPPKKTPSKWENIKEIRFVVNGQEFGATKIFSRVARQKEEVYLSDSLDFCKNIPIERFLRLGLRSQAIIKFEPNENNLRDVLNEICSGLNSANLVGVAPLENSNDCVCIIPRQERILQYLSIESRTPFLGCIMRIPQNKASIAFASVKDNPEDDPFSPQFRGRKVSPRQNAHPAIGRAITVPNPPPNIQNQPPVSSYPPNQHEYPPNQQNQPLSSYQRTETAPVPMSSVSNHSTYGQYQDIPQESYRDYTVGMKRKVDDYGLNKRPRYDSYPNSYAQGQSDGYIQPNPSNYQQTPPNRYQQPHPQGHQPAHLLHHQSHPGPHVAPTPYQPPAVHHQGSLARHPQELHVHQPTIHQQPIHQPHVHHQPMHQPVYPQSQQYPHRPAYGQYAHHGEPHRPHSNGYPHDYDHRNRSEPMPIRDGKVVPTTCIWMSLKSIHPHRTKEDVYAELRKDFGDNTKINVTKFPNGDFNCAFVNFPTVKQASDTFKRNYLKKNEVVAYQSMKFLKPRDHVYDMYEKKGPTRR